MARCFKIKLFWFLCALLKSTYLATLILTLPLKAQTWRSPPPIPGRTVTCLGDEFEWVLLPWGKVCLSTWKLLWPSPPSSMLIPDLAFCLWDGSSSFSPQTCALTFQWLQNTAQPRGMMGSGEAGQRIFLSVGCAEWRVGGRAHRLLFQLTGLHTHSELAPRPPGPCLPHLCWVLPATKGWYPPSVQHPSYAEKFCVSVLISGWVESPQGSASFQVWYPWITPCLLSLPWNEWMKSGPSGFFHLHQPQTVPLPSFFHPLRGHSAFLASWPHSRLLRLRDGHPASSLSSRRNGGLWSHPAPQKGWPQGLYRSGRWGYFMTQKDLEGRK